MEKTISATIIVTLLLFAGVSGMHLFEVSSANFIPESPPSGIQITNNGDIAGTNKIQRSQNTYTLTGDIEGTIIIERDGIILDGAGYTIRGQGDGVGVFLQERNGVTIKNLRIRDYHYGIKFTWFGYGNYGATRNNTISNNAVTDNTYGVFFNDFSKGNTIIGNEVKNNVYGIYLSACQENLLRDNSLENNDYNFFVSGGTLSSSVNDIDQSNTINGDPIIYWHNQNEKTIPENAAYIALVNCTRISIKNFDLSHNGQSILLVGLTDSVITNNTIRNNANGIWLIESEKNQITNNTIENNIYDAIYMSNSNNNEVASNTFANNGHSGIEIAQVLGSVGRGVLRLTQSSNNNIKDNNITGNGEGINLQTSNYNVINKNILNGNNGSAVHFFDCKNNTVRTNTIIHNNGSGIKLWMTNNTVVQSNYISNNSLGIHLDSAAKNTVIQNTISYNTGFGIQLNSASSHFMCSADNIIYHNNFIFNQQGEGLDVSIPGLWVHPEGFVPGVGNVWDNGKEGNYWSEYEIRYSNASKVANTNIYDTPYYINEYNIDHYPLIAPFENENDLKPSSDENITEKPESFPFLLTTFSSFTILLVAGLLVYNKKSK